MALLEEAQNASEGPQMPQLGTAPVVQDQTNQMPGGPGLDSALGELNAAQKPGLPGIEPVREQPGAEMPEAEMPAQQDPMVGSSIALPESLAGADTTQLVQDATQNINNQQVRPEETVSGQMENLLAQDSTYMQMHRAAGERQAGRRGLQNSSIAGQSGQAAAIASAQPIAAADASVYQKVYGDKRMFDFDTVRQATQNTYDDALVRLEGAGRERLADIEGQWRSLMQTSASSADFLTQFQRDVASIANNTDYSTEQQEAAINLLVSSAQNSMSLIGDIGGVEGLDQYLTYLDLSVKTRDGDFVTETDVTDTGATETDATGVSLPDQTPTNALGNPVPDNYMQDAYGNWYNHDQSSGG